MSEILEPTFEQPGDNLLWSEVWITVLARPSIYTFERIIRDPHACPRRAYLWLFTSGIIGGLISSLAIDRIDGINTGLIKITFEPIITAMACMMSLIFVTWVIQLIAGTLYGGRGNYASMIYTTAAFWAPLFIINSLILGIPYVQFLALPLSIYELILGVIALKAVNKIGWWQAADSYIGSIIVVIGIGAVITLFTGLWRKCCGNAKNFSLFDRLQATLK